MLPQNLRDLVRDGLVHREVEPSAPPKVSCSLTPLGEGLATSLDVIAAQHRHDALRSEPDLSRWTSDEEKRCCGGWWLGSAGR
ncbi:winged helix-turn-helix transcriptional regulator [Nonomuraea spiralis]|uniref:Winged helix-turn-helix transcriptional regulator n=1 Tax=Nonomuraea spiralis TaxID=46182 RepID=A0ABV5IZM9_9ACTN|nr:winged helix-turn-helix transcriptional regulator [Nonomuraea spiralis]GGT19538.1 hypothetical protein GCM10010176_075090 [Nonomuraea spiralis]